MLVHIASGHAMVHRAARQYTALARTALRQLPIASARHLEAYYT
jgi:hypothetical protein